MPDEVLVEQVTHLLEQRISSAELASKPRAMEFPNFELDVIACERNIRSRKRFGFVCPTEVMADLMVRHHQEPPSHQKQ